MKTVGLEKRGIASFLAWALFGGVASSLLAGCLGQIAEQPGLTEGTMELPPGIKTQFVEGASLTPAEVIQVLGLARKCGLTNAASLETFRYLPSRGHGICVKSQEKIDGRDVFYDTIYIDRRDWQ